MTQKRKENQPTPTSGKEFDPLVACVSCDAIVSPENAEVRYVNIHGKPIKVWFCKTCIGLGESRNVGKYVMRKVKRAWSEKS